MYLIHLVEAAFCYPSRAMLTPLCLCLCITLKWFILHLLTLMTQRHFIQSPFVNSHQLFMHWFAAVCRSKIVLLAVCHLQSIFCKSINGRNEVFDSLAILRSCVLFSLLTKMSHILHPTFLSSLFDYLSGCGIFLVYFL